MKKVYRVLLQLSIVLFAFAFVVSAGSGKTASSEDKKENMAQSTNMGQKFKDMMENASQKAKGVQENIAQSNMGQNFKGMMKNANQKAKGVKKNIEQSNVGQKLKGMKENVGQQAHCKFTCSIQNCATYKKTYDGCKTDVKESRCTEKQVANCMEAGKKWENPQDYHKNLECNDCINGNCEDEKIYKMCTSTPSPCRYGGGMGDLAAQGQQCEQDRQAAIQKKRG